MALLAAALLLVTAALDIPTETLEAASEANVDAVELQGALLSVGEPDPRRYLRHSGELPWPVPSGAAVGAGYSPRLHALADCIIWRESRGNPSAVNPRSGASGLGQFLRSTWATTPQGKAGYSVFNAAANREAVLYMLSVGRGREFVTIGGCL
jgi:hypothetical protein